MYCTLKLMSKFTKYKAASESVDSTFVVRKGHYLFSFKHLQILMVYTTVDGDSLNSASLI